jgi:acyl-CoA thioesterase
VSLTVTAAMTNFHGITHGGVVFSLADVALGAASNSRGTVAYALNLSVTYLRATRAGVRLVAEARERHVGAPTGLYDVTVTEAGGELVATAQAIVYRKRDSFVATADRSPSGTPSRSGR